MPTDCVLTIKPQVTMPHYERLMADIDSILWEADAQPFQYTYVSEHAERLFGYPAAQWLQPNFWLDHLHPADRDRAVDCYQRATNENRNHSLEYRMIAADGRIVWLRAVVSVIRADNQVSKLYGIMTDITEHKQAEGERQAHLHFWESMDKINRAIQGTNDFTQMLHDVLDATLAIFGCDRAWLLYPCEPDAATWSVPMERTRPEYPGAFITGVETAMDADLVQMFRILHASNGPVQFGPGAAYPLPVATATQYQIQSVIALAIYPKVDKPYLFSLHQCAQPRQWTSQEERLLQAIGHRLVDALNSLVSYCHLQESERRYREIFDNSSDVLAISEVTTDSRFKLLDVNPALCKMLGLNQNQLIGTFLEDFAQVQESARTLLAEHRQCLAQKTPVAVEKEWETPTGRWPVHFTLIPVSNDAGQIYRIVGMGRNLTAQRRAEDRLRVFLDHATDAFFLHDASGIVLDVNRRACEMLGYTREELIGMSPLVFDPNLDSQFAAAMNRHLAAGQTIITERSHRCKDGSIYPIEIRIRPVWQNGEQFNVSLVQDITERKRTEQALIESHNLLNAIVEGTTDMTFAKDRQGRYLMMNSAGARLMGRPLAEIIGKDDRDLFPAEIADEVMRKDRLIMATGETQTFEETVRGSVVRTFLTTKGVHRDSNGTVNGIVAIARDITELKRLEEQFRQAQKMEAVGRLAGGVAHDFNNLLTVINGYSQIVFNRLPATDPNRPRLAEIQKAGERAASLTRQLLAFSRKQMLQPEVVNLNTLLNELLKLLQRLIGEDIELTLTTAVDLGLTKIDPAQFEQAIINLAVNARDAMPQGGRLTITTCNTELDAAYAERYSELQAGAYVCVTVIDTGCGMDEATLARIFEPFFTTKDIGKGTGLGLAMVYGFVKQSGGHVEVFSEVGRGTTFRIYLPRTEEADLAVKAELVQRDIPKGNETLLLVEDEEAVRNLFCAVLCTGGYTVLEAHDGQSALELAQQHAGAIHLLITDLVMPRMSGRQLADSLRVLQPNMRVLFMSGYTEEAVTQHRVQELNIAFLQKPFDPLSLAQKVRDLLDSSEK